MKFDVQIKQSELSVSSEIVSDKSLCFVVDFPMLKGKDGRDGFTWRPTVNAEGDLSWSDDSSTTPPPSINVMGNDGVNGKDAQINGVNTLTIKEGENVKISQSGSELIISSEINEVVRGEIDGKADKPIAGRSFLTPLFISRGAVFNDKTGFYELNGILDIGEEEMKRIYAYTSQTPNSNSWDAMFWTLTKVRTNFEPNGLHIYAKSAASFAQTEFEVVSIIKNSFVNAHKIVIDNLSTMFHGSAKLKKIIGILDLSEVLSVNNIQGLSQTPALIDVKLFKLSFSIYFNNSSNLSMESIIYLLTNRVNAVDKPITITLHPTVFAVASTNPDVQALLPATTTKGEALLASA